MVDIKDLGQASECNSGYSSARSSIEGTPAANGHRMSQGGRMGGERPSGRGDEYDYNTTGDRQASSYSRGGRHVHSDGDGDSEEDDDYGGPSIPPPPGFIEEWDQIAREFQARQQDWPGGPLRDPVEADAPPADLPPGPRVPIDEFRDAEGCLRFPEDWRRGDPEPDLTMEAEDAMIRMCEEFKTKGNDAYRERDMPLAESLYSRAVSESPPARAERAVYFGNRAAVRMAVGDHDAAVRDCSRALALQPDYVRVLVRRATCYEHIGEEVRALDDWRKVADLDMGNRQARAAIPKLEPRVRAQQEKLKEEMVEKLKGLGNSILGKFGLSLDNFKLQPNPSGEGYSIQFSQGGEGGSQ